jgi:hypothetical protein
MLSLWNVRKTTLATSISIEHQQHHYQLALFFGVHISSGLFSASEPVRDGPNHSFYTSSHMSPQCKLKKNVKYQIKKGEK